MRREAAPKRARLVRCVPPLITCWFSVRTASASTQKMFQLSMSVLYTPHAPSWFLQLSQAVSTMWFPGTQDRIPEIAKRSRCCPGTAVAPAAWRAGKADSALRRGGPLLRVAADRFDGPECGTKGAQAGRGTPAK
jgi:hypothetical protein